MSRPSVGDRAGLGSIAGIGLVAGTMEVAVSLSFSALLFAGMGSAAYARGAAFVLFGTMLSNLIASRWSSMPGAVIVPQDTSTAILAATAAPFLAGLDPEIGFPTMLAYVAAGTALTGLLMWLVGLIRQGGLIRFIPLPVIGGFLAGTGYHLVVGGSDVITRGFDWNTARVAALVAGCLFALGMLLVLRRWPRPGLVPGSVAVGAALFFIALLVTGTSMSEARSLGLLMESVRTGLGLPFSELASADWSVVRVAWGGLATVPLVATLGMLLNVNALEMIRGEDADLDRELRAVGMANLAGAASAMPAAYHTVGITALGYRVGVRSRAIPVVVGVVCLVAIVVGGPLLSLLPMPVIGGLLIYLGLDFITEWFVDRRRHMTGPEVLLMAAIVVAVATLGMLLNVNALEMIRGEDADLDRELRAVGMANLAGSVSAMPAAYHTLGITALGYRVGVRSRAIPVVVGAVCLVAIVIGGPLLSLLPMPVVGGLLIYLGLDFITEWFVDRRRHMTGPEVLLMAAIVVAVATLGFLVAVGLGLVASTIIFAVRYSAIDPVRHAATGLETRSVVDRPSTAAGVLAERGDRILVVQLQGFLFFGTAKLAVERIDRLVTDRQHLEALVLDLERVSGADATGLSVIAKVAAMAERRGATLLVSSPPAPMQTELDAVIGEQKGLEVMPDLDHALERAENIVIGDITSPDSCDLDEVFPSGMWRRLRPHLTRREIEAGDTVIREGESTTGVFIVEEGRLVTTIPTDRGYRRVRSSGPGSFVGEMSIYRSGGRSARVTAVEPCVLWVLDDRALARIEKADPRLAVDVHRVMASAMAESVARGNLAVAALLR